MINIRSHNTPIIIICKSIISSWSNTERNVKYKYIIKSRSEIRLYVFRLIYQKSLMLWRAIWNSLRTKYPPICCLRRSKKCVTTPMSTGWKVSKLACRVIIKMLDPSIWVLVVYLYIICGVFTRHLFNCSVDFLTRHFLQYHISLTVSFKSLTRWWRYL